MTSVEAPRYVVSASRLHGRRTTEMGLGRDRLLGRIAVAVTPELRGLSARELEILALAAEGRTSVEIGKQLYLAEETVKSHIANVLRCLGARNRAHAVAIGFRRGLLGGR